MSPEAGITDAWLLTARISPRAHVRVASVDASGAVLNQYAQLQRVDGPAPDVPWAVHLADHDGYRLIAFDLDAKHGTAAADADRLSELLSDQRIDHLVVRSGPSEGRHIWVALTDPAAPDTVATLARLIAGICRSLDLAPLSNPATGCVRPPGSPHRDGGTASILTGNPTTLTIPGTTPSQLHHLAETVAALINHGSPRPTAADAPTGIRLDTIGQPYLPGSRKPLPPGSAAALHQDTTGTDASTVLWRILLGAAAHHWHLADIAALAPTAAGLEHLRSRRNATGRHSRSRYDQAATLTRQWRYAVTFAASHPRDIGADTTFDDRAADTADTIRLLQTRADAAPGRWLRGGGPADRRVLDTLHLLALTALTTTIEADIRRIALTAGIGRETARTALLRLAADGWTSKALDAAGVHGAHWTVDPADRIHRGVVTARSQAVTRPEGAGTAERTLLLTELDTRIQLLRHDLFTTAHALPLASGNSYARLSPTTARTPQDAAELNVLQLLTRHGLARTTGGGWVRADATRRDAIATRLGLNGRLRARAGRYQAERDVWSWWQAEQDWMTSPRPTRDRRQPPAQAPLWHSPAADRYPKHPRRRDGRADYAAARSAHRHGALRSPDLAA